MNFDLVLAGLVLTLHLLFILWVVGGILVVRHYPRLKWVHIVSLAYGIFVEIRMADGSRKNPIQALFQ